MSQSYCTAFDHVVEAAISGTTVLTANTRSARSVATACERRLSPQKVWKTPTVLPLSAWMQQVWRDAQSRGVTDKALLRPIQELKIWEQIIERTGGMGELLRPSSAAPQASQAWRLVQAYRISLRSSAFASTRQCREFLDWTKAYENICRELNAIDSAILPDQLLSVARSAKDLLPGEILVWGFDEFTPQQLNLFNGVRELGIDCEVAEYVSDETRPIRVELADAEQEFVIAARWARGVIEQDPATKIAIVVPGLAGARSSIEQVFLHELNPEFFGGVTAERAFDVSLGLSLGSYAVIRTATLALRFATQTLSFAEVRELLTSPYLHGSCAEASARARSVSLLSEVVPDKISLTTLLAKLEHDKLREVSCPQLRRSLKEFQSQIKGLPSRAPYGRWMRQVHALLNSLGWPSETGTRGLDSAEYQATQKWRDVLTETASLESVSNSCTWRTALAAVLHGASETVFAPENRAAAVQILGESEAAGSVFDAVWICGLTDEAWPPRRRANPFIPIALQKSLGVPGSSPELGVTAARQILTRLMNSAEQVVLSSPLAEADRVLRTSGLVSGIPLSECASLTLSNGMQWEEMPPADCELIDDSIAPTVTAEELTHRGTSVIEKQANCPFRAFAESRLEAKGIDEPPVGIRPTARGNLVEIALQRVWESLREQSVLLNIAEDQLDQIIEAAVDRAISEKLEPTGDPLQARLGAIERDRLVRLIHEWLDVECNRDRFEVLEHQRQIKFTIGGMEMKGAIDRVDRVADGFVVLDYKAGSNYSANHWRLPRPQRPQLPLYAVALAQEGKEVAGLTFAKVTSGNCDLAGLSTRPEVLGKNKNMLSRYTEGRTLPEQIEAWRSEFSRLAADHLAGRAEVDPKSPPSNGGKRNTSCAYCDLDALCRVAELNLAIDSEEGNNDEQR